MRWTDVNGWDVLFKNSRGTVPGLTPFWLTAQISLAASADFATSVTGTAAVVVGGDAELFVLGGICGGSALTLADALHINEGLGAVADHSPDMYPATVTIQEGNGGRTISGGPCFIGHLFGGGPTPYLWPAPWRVPAGTDLTFTLEHRYTTQQDVWLTLFGFKRPLDEPPLPVDFLIEPRLVRLLAKYRAAGRLVSPEPFFYPMAFSGTAGRAPFQTEQQTFAITEADFALVHLAGAVSDPFNGDSWLMESGRVDNNRHQEMVTEPGRGIAQETVRLITGLGRVRLDDRPVAIGALFGTGRNIGRYPSPLVLPRGDSLTALLNFRDATSGSNLPLRADLTFGGVRLVEY